MWHKYGFVKTGLTLFAMAGAFGCGSSSSGKTLTLVRITPATADAQNFPGGQVQFTAMGSYAGSSSMVPLANITWCIGSATGVCNGSVASAGTIDGNGLAQCNAGLSATVTVLAGTGPPSKNPDAGQQLTVFGTAQLTCP